MNLSIIIPVFNEGKTVHAVLEKVIAVKIPGVTLEVVVVDDGSTDTTVDEVRNFIKTHKQVQLFVQPKNNGKGSAIIRGLQQATGDFILIQDGDLEYDPKYIPELISPILEKKAQVVFGTRLKRLPNFRESERTPLFLLHYIGNRALSLLTSVMYGQWITDMETGYKVFPRKMFVTNTLQSKSFAIEPEITARLMRAGLKIVEVPITTNPRGYNEGKKLHALRDGSLALLTLLKYRVKS